MKTITVEASAILAVFECMEEEKTSGSYGIVIDPEDAVEELEFLHALDDVVNAGNFHIDYNRDIYLYRKGEPEWFGTFRFKDRRRAWVFYYNK